MKLLKYWVLFFLMALTLIVSNGAVAQNGAPQPDESVMVEANSNASDIEMADQLRRDGKIYIVVGCVLVVLVGMLFYLISIDKKVSRLEKEFKS